jgi:hypothetical protein
LRLKTHVFARAIILFKRILAPGRRKLQGDVVYGSVHKGNRIADGVIAQMYLLY